MKVSVQITGVRALREKLKIKNVSGPLSDGIKKATLLLDREVKQATVVDTGRLRSGIVSKFASDSGQVGTNVQYAQFVEYGRGTMEARHMEGGIKVLGKGMFTYAMEQLKDKIKDLIGDIADKIEMRWR